MSERFSADRFLDVLECEGLELAERGRRRGPGATIQACPGWTVNDLVGHVGWVYRWVASVVGERRSVPPSADERAALGDPDPSDPDGVRARLLEAHHRLVKLLRDAPVDLGCWTIWPGSTAREFWIRRMVHETVVHRIDAEDDGTAGTSLGRVLNPVVAADGVDEMVCGFARRYSTWLRAESHVVLTLRSTDADGTWWIRMGPDEPTFGRGPAPTRTAAHVEGTAGELLLLLWNRRTPDGLDVIGDPEVLEAWRRGSHL